MLPTGRRITLPPALVSRRLILRNRKAGDRIGCVKLKKLLESKKLSLLERNSLVLAEEGGEIVWAEELIPL